MLLRNLTPFDVLCYGALAPDDHENRVVAMKVGYRLLPVDGEPGRFNAQVMDRDALELVTADTFYGEPGESSTRQESDLAPYKPRCDVIVNGHAHAPGGLFARHWDARIRVSAPLPPLDIAVERPRPLSPGMALTAQQQAQWRQALELAEQQRADAPTQHVLLDKTLRVTGPREFRRRGLFTGWRLTPPTPVDRVPLRWEYAFGGRSVVRNPKYVEGSTAPRHALNEVCFSNPLGKGWMDGRYLQAALAAGDGKIKRMPAPQIETLDAPTRQLISVKLPKGDLPAPAMAKVARECGSAPAGFGVVGRAWAPRLALAGTYDDHWLETRWPGVPLDIDYGYWNCAPPDQQIAFLPADSRIELWQLTPAELTPRGGLTVDLPGHRAFVLLRLVSGALLPLMLKTDTLIVDTDEMTLQLTHRLTLPRDAQIRVAEARFETDPAAPLLRAGPEVGAPVAESS
ncbi:DUF2169 domain-containing protein [Lysobacter sp. Root690]|uniref:DUF2169 family type VI secretion system accessory protein n=1 Tax=Lysobacter sp. Root690 TaxID=1736588 RepID=UPI0006F84BBD|nr:DUF2169 domain-containing protein [Lysobacter sp. Root690]KRB03397.1 hypothetical protein ASD86_21225 [Lysobacter sp. Root690]